MPFNVGDMVRIRENSEYYGRDEDDNPGGSTGFVREVDRYSPSNHTVHVEWASGRNVYRVSDLEYAVEQEVIKKKRVTHMRNEQVILEAVESLKSSEFKATAIKVELEANIDRHEDCEDVKQMILRDLVELGLAKKAQYGYVPIKPLTYLHVYNDHSVDTECTFTLLLTKPKDILLLPKIIEIFRNVCEESGYCFETYNAGMHLALLNNVAGKYPARPKPGDKTRFKNFRKSMIRLLPALYFLGSHDSTSRELRFRKPQITDGARPSGGMYSDDNQKYSAVAYREGAVEFRVFETCYDNPGAILDMVVVMSNAMKFWTTEYTRNYVPRFKKVKFGVRSGHDLQRMYCTEQHIDLLNAGLNVLKPSYYTIRQLKQQRDFTVTKQGLNAKLKKVRETARENYKEYEKRFGWEMVYAEQGELRHLVERVVVNSDQPEDIEVALEELRAKAKKTARKNLKKKTIDEHIEEAVSEVVPDGGGHWELDVSENAPDTASSATLTDDTVARAIWTIDTAFRTEPF